MKTLLALLPMTCALVVSGAAPVLMVPTDRSDYTTEESASLFRQGNSGAMQLEARTEPSGYEP